MNDSTSNNLLSIVKNNVYNSLDDDFIEFKTRIYSDSFESYQVSDFSRYGYILNKINHSVWFVQGLFHINTVEGIWSQIKSISNDFFGFNFKILEEMEKEGINPKDYLDNWICYSLFFREYEMKKFTDGLKREFLNKILI